ncbi:MAG: hypothetical protein BZ136_07800 [Methanosphaera sp. rholeuAM74]|nr:MAG: hypothetical protein BZ136_07800 [Methanosphaera sp. rholeuAM74]
MVDVIIVGGGRVGVLLLELLEINVGYNITLIDNRKEIVQNLEKRYPDANIIHGDATNRKVLENAGIETADIVVATSSIDEINLLIGIISQEYNLEKIIARTSNPTHIKMFKKLGLNEVVSPELTAVTDIEKRIIRPNVTELSVSTKGDCELLDLPVKSKKIIGKRIGDISPTEKFIIVSCHKGDETFIAENDIILEEDDEVTVLLKTKHTKKVKNYFCKKHTIL